MSGQHARPGLSHRVLRRMLVGMGLRGPESVADPETPVWNQLVRDWGWAPELAAAQTSSHAGHDADDGDTAAGTAAHPAVGWAVGEGPRWPLDENATFHGVSHR